MLQFKFLGILMGVAIRTKKPLDLHLAPLVWKQLCCIPLQLEDLEEVDLLYVQTLKSILHIEDSGITEDNFHEVGHKLKLGCGGFGNFFSITQGHQHCDPWSPLFPFQKTTGIVYNCNLQVFTLNGV